MLTDEALLDEIDRSSAVREALADYQIIFANAIVGICYTRERVIYRCNRRFEEMFGYEPNELDGESVQLLYPTLEAYERIGQHGYDYLMTHNTYSDERIMKRKSGELFWCTVGGRKLDIDKPLRRNIWIFQDVSKRKRAEEGLQRANERLEQRVLERTAELREANLALRAEMAIREQTEEELRASREKYRVLFETLPVGISITDDQGTVIEINQALNRISSQATQAALMRELRTPGALLIHPDGSPVTHEELPSSRALRDQKAVNDVELGVRYSNGRTRWFSVTAAPIPVKGYGVAMAHTEITERKRMQEQERHQRAELAQVARRTTMGEMAAALAHELGQPLSSTLNYLHGCQLRLDARDYDPAIFGSAISQAICHAERAGDILKHIRQFVRRHEPETVSGSINGLIEEMVTFLDFERQQYDAQIRLVLEPDLPEVMMDLIEIKQVVLNLFKNGLEAMGASAPASRLLEIGTRRRGRWIEVSVSDRGPGISRKHLTQIFNAFFTTKRNGIGLGLAICRSVIESHGGQLKAERNVHSGATFKFTLPVGK